MQKEILEFLAANTTCVLSVAMPDGNVHAATLHFAHNEEPFEIYLNTRSDSKKYEALVNGKAKSSIVVGVSDESWITIQMDGEVVEVTNREEVEALKKVFYEKHPNDVNFVTEKTVYLKFITSWWRYSDYSIRPPKILGSDRC